MVQRAARLIVLHVPDQKNRTARLDDLTQLVGYLSPFEINHIDLHIILENFMLRGSEFQDL